MGLSDEQITKIMNDMKANKIFTASEENLDTRYGKLKTDHENVEKQLKEAQTLIEQLKKGTGEVDALTAENEKLKLESALKLALLDAGAKASDIDYLMFKAGTGDRELKMGEDGKLKGQDDLIAGLKTQFPGNFTAPDTKKVVEHKLEGGEGGAGDPAEPKNLAEALKLQYETSDNK